MKKVRKLIAIYLVLTLLSGVLSVSVFATAAGTEEDPLLVEPNPMIENMYLMNDSLEAGDADGIWYELTIHSDGILAVSVNCKADVAYDVEVYAGDYVGLASKGSPVITYCVTAGDTVIVHKFVRADESGDIPALSGFYVSADIVAGNMDDPLNMISTVLTVPVAADSSVCLTEKNNRVNYYGRALVVSGPANVISKTSVAVGSETYTDVDKDGQIEMALPGGYESRPVITISNYSGIDAVYTFRAVDEATESEPVYVAGDINADNNVNNDDVVMLLWHTLFAEDYPIDAPADFTADGTVNNDDVVYLLWNTLFPGDYPLS